MRFYFELQYKRIVRWFENAGFNPYIGFAISVLIFILFSNYIFYKVEYASWLYMAIAGTFLLKLGESNRNYQLELIFGSRDYLKVRFIENGITILPFVLFLLWKQAVIVILILILISVFLAITKLNLNLHFVLPTPFKRLPFEYTIGFRKSLLLLLFCYFLIYKAIEVNNYNLAAVSMGMMFLIAMSFYFKPEDKYFVWIYSLNSRGFIKRKIINSFISSFILVFLALILLCLAFPANIIITITIYLVSNVFLLSVVLAKYSAFPNEISLPQGLLYAISLWFPPMLIFVLPIFYKQAKRKLDTIL